MPDPIPITKREMIGAPKQRLAKVYNHAVQIPGNGTMLYCSVQDESDQLIASAHVWVKNMDSAQPLLNALAEAIRQKVTRIIS
jgi:hypothetical protein